MNSLIFLFASLVLLASCEITLDEGVLVLDESNFDGAIAENELILVEFYAPWCGHCKKLTPEYASAAQKLAAEGSSIKLAKVDATENGDLASKFGVQGYPTLKWFKNGSPVDYNGPRDSAGIYQWVMKKSGPASSLLASQEEIDAFLAKEGTLGLAFISTEQVTAWEQISGDGLFEEFLFAHVTDSALFGDNKEGTVQVHKSGEDSLTFDGEFAVKSVSTFFAEEGFPIVDELAQESWTRAMDSKKSLIAVFYEEDDEATDAIALSVGKAYKGKYVTTSSSQIGIAERWGASGKTIPTAVFVDNSAKQPKLVIWNEETEGPMTVETLTAFIEAAVSGDYAAFEKSEPIPESNDGPVTVVVNKQFDEIVRQKKDVLVEFYAPWCGHCKKLVPVYEELGAAFKDDENVVIAKMDATANNVAKDFNVRGFPTLILVDANNKQVSFDGERDLEGLTAFINEKRVSSPSAPAPAEAEKEDL